MSVQSYKRGNKDAVEEFRQKIAVLAKELERLAKEEGGSFVGINKSDVMSHSVSGGNLVVGGGAETVDRLVRLREVLQYIPVSKSSFYDGIKSGRYPQPVKGLGPRISAWSLNSILKIVNGEGNSHE